MSLKTNANFIKEFNSLDSILKDIYDSDVPSKLGVTRYLEEMKANDYQGNSLVSDWDSSYNKLKYLRNARNDAVHIDMESAYFDNSDIDWIISFKNSVLSATDPLSRLYKIKYRKISGVPHNVKYKSEQQTFSKHNLPKKTNKNFSNFILFCSIVLFLYIIFKMLINS